MAKRQVTCPGSPFSEAPLRDTLAFSLLLPLLFVALIVLGIVGAWLIANEYIPKLWQKQSNWRRRRRVRLLCRTPKPSILV